MFNVLFIWHVLRDSTWQNVKTRSPLSLQQKSKSALLQLTG